MGVRAQVTVRAALGGKRTRHSPKKSYERSRLLSAIPSTMRRFSGSLSRAGANGPARLELWGGGPKLFRDPARTAHVPARGLTVQASVQQPNQRIPFHVCRPPEKDSAAPCLLSMLSATTMSHWPSSRGTH